MSAYTKQAIKNSFLKLLNDRPLNQVTVKAIVEDCGINRNTFYYHFTDIPSLATEIITERADQIIRAVRQSGLAGGVSERCRAVHDGKPARSYAHVPFDQP